MGVLGSIRQTDLEGVSAKNGKRGTRAHAILEENVPKVNERYRGTGYGAQAEQFRLPSPDGIKPGEIAFKRQKYSRGLDVVISKDGKPTKGMDLKTGSAKFPEKFKQRTTGQPRLESGCGLVVRRTSILFGLTLDSLG